MADDVAHVSWVGSALYGRSCATPHSGRRGATAVDVWSCVFGVRVTVDMHGGSIISRLYLYCKTSGVLLEPPE